MNMICNGSLLQGDCGPLVDTTLYNMRKASKLHNAFFTIVMVGVANPPEDQNHLIIIIGCCTRLRQIVDL